MEHNNAEPRARLLTLLRWVDLEVDAIDKATTSDGSMVEPDWWCDAMDLQRLASNLRVKHFSKEG